MSLIRNKITPNQRQEIPKIIGNFMLESGMSYDPYLFIDNTINNIIRGIKNEALHDIWLSEDCKVYCLCRVEKDADGELVYTAYQLYIDPELRIKSVYRKLIYFLRFYAQKNKLKRMYIVSSRLDKIKAYQRGIGYSFKPKYLTFAEQY